MAETLEFRAFLWRGAMRRLGLSGKSANVRLEPDAVHLRGEKSGEARIAFARIARLRTGFVESRTGLVHRLRIWPEGEAKPVDLYPGDDRSRYGRFVRALVAAALRDATGIRIETGSSNFVPVLVIGSFGFLTIASAAFSIYLAATEDDWTIPLGALALSALLLAVLGPWALSRHRPRRIASIEEIERALPGC